MFKVQEKTSDAVSPVIGVILLVAVTVALVALATVIVFDIGSDVSDTADATVQLEATNGGNDATATVIRNENVDTFTLSGTTINGNNVEASLAGDAGSTATISGVSITEKTETGITQDDSASAIDTDGDQVTLANTPVDSLKTVVDNGSADDGSADITGAFTLIDSSTIEYDGSQGSLTSIDVTYDYESGSEQLSTATVIANLAGGNSEVLTSTDISG
jgi:flagellin-like protein